MADAGNSAVIDHWIAFNLNPSGKISFLNATSPIGQVMINTRVGTWAIMQIAKASGKDAILAKSVEPGAGLNLIFKNQAKVNNSLTPSHSFMLRSNFKYTGDLLLIKNP